MFKRITAVILALALGSLIACSSNSIITTSDNNLPTEIYEVHHDGRMHVFYDRALYKEFLSLGETPFRLTRIAAGPRVKPLSFGLTSADKKKTTGIAAVDLYDGKLQASSNFYAEMVSHNRIYVFDKFDDMKTVRDFGHPNFQYSEIGAGPRGETVVYVLNKDNKKHRPETLIKKFNSFG